MKKDILKVFLSLGLLIGQITFVNYNSSSDIGAQTDYSNNENYGVGSKYAIYAEDFTISKSQVELTDTAIISEASIKVFDIETNLDVTDQVSIDINSNEYSSEEGEYSLVATVNEDVSANISFNALVTIGVDPVLTITPAFVELDISTGIDALSNYSELSGVIATDLEDGNIIANVTADIDINEFTEPGIYVVTYTAVDSDGNVATATRIVVVNDGSYTVGNNYIIQATDFILSSSEVGLLNLDTDILIKADPKVYNKLTGGEISGPVLSVSLGIPPLTSIPGDYPVLITYNLEVALVTATVVGGSSPVIDINPDFEELDISTNTDALVNYDEMSGVVVTDAEDGNLVATTDTTIDETTPAGVYNVVYTATDSDGNSVSATKIVVVNDGTLSLGDNYIISAKDFDLRVGQVDVENIDSQVISESETTVYNKLTGEAIVTTDADYTVSYDPAFTNEIGSYDITITYDNESIGLTTSIVSGEIPEIVIDSTFEELDISANLDALINYDKMTGVVATDVEDGDLVATTDITIDETTPAGVYNVVYTVVDSDGNSATATKVVVVNDSTLSVGDSYIISAKDFDLRVGEVDLENIDSQVISKSEITVYNKLSGEVIPTTDADYTVSYNPAITNEIGSYDVVITYDSQSISITTSIVSGETPEIVIDPSFEELDISLNNNALLYYDEMSGVVATDAEDGDLVATTDIVINEKTDPGVYKVVYSVTDSDGNSATATKVVAVNDSTLSVGDSYIILANSFEIGIGEVDLINTDTQVITNSGVAVYDKLTGEVIATTLADYTVSYQGTAYTNQVGTYDVSLSYNSESINIMATVISGNAPELSINPSYEELDISAGVDALLNYDEMAGVVATDVEDGDISLNVVVDTTIDETTTAGVYPVVYTITDADGNVVSVTKVVVVNDGTLSIGDSYIISAEDFTLRVGEVDLINTNSQVISESQVIVYDKIGGSAIVLDPMDYVITYQNQVYTNMAGSYDINIAYDNESIDITAIVSNGEVPELTIDPSYEELDISVNSDALVNYDEMAGVVATDVEDGSLVATPDITINETTEVGVYPVVYTAIDSDGNTTTTKKVVVVNDGTLSIGDNYILSANDFELRVGEVDLINTNNQVISESQAMVYDKVSGEVIELETLDYAITYQNQAYTNVVGNYDINIAYDTESIDITASVISGELPELIVDPSFEELDISTNTDVLANYDEMAGVSALDLEDGDISANVMIDTTIDETTNVGVYEVIYTVTDSDGNSATATKIVVVNDSTLSVGNSYILSANDFELRVGEVDLINTDSQVVSLSEAMVYDKVSGEVISTTQADYVVTYGDPLFTNVAGSYDINIAYNNESIDIVATVTTGEAPKITIDPSFEELDISAGLDVLVSYNEMNGVEATDTEDGDISADIVIDTIIDDTVGVGIYPVVYTITDSDGNVVSATKVVVINDSTFTIGDNYIISANDFELRAGEVDLANTDSQVISMSEAMVYDKSSGEMVSTTVVDYTIDYGTNGYTNIVGSYDIVLTYNNDSANITVEVLTGNLPSLTVSPEFIEISTLELGVYDEMSGVSALDLEDGDISANVVVDTAIDESTAPGVYTVFYTVVDSDGNEGVSSRVVLVNDGTFTTGSNYILRASDFRVGYNQWSGEDSAILNLAKVELYDIRDTSKAIEVGDLSIINVDYLNWSKQEGLETTITLSVTSLQARATGNDVETTINASVDNLPTYSFNTDAIALSQVPETEEELVEYLTDFSVVDAEDGDLTEDVLITYPNYTDIQAGEVFKVSYAVADSSDNSISIERSMYVDDGQVVRVGDYLLSANSFSMGLNEYDISVSNIAEKSSLRVYNLEGAQIELSNASDLNIDVTGVEEKIGDYKVYFTSISSGEAHEVDLTVVGNESASVSYFPSGGFNYYLLLMSLITLGVMLIIRGVRKYFIR